MKSKPPIPDLVSMLDAARLSPDWLQRVVSRARVYLDANPERPEATHLRRIIDLADRAERSIERGDAQGAAIWAMGAIQAAWQAEMVQGRVVVADGFKKRSGDRNRTEKTVEARKTEAAKRTDEHPKIVAAVAHAERKMPSAGRREIYEEVGKQFELKWRTVCNLVSEAKKVAK